MKRPSMVIIGAGFAGRAIAEEIKSKGILGKTTAFIDDDEKKIGSTVDGIPVLGPISRISTLKERLGAEEALIAIPTAEKKQLRRIYQYLKEARFSKIRILPGISQIIDGDPHLIQAREVDPQDLLGRTPVAIPLKESLSYLRGKRVLITGAGGSIGSELSRQLLSGGAERLYLFGHGENSIYEIERELRLLQEEGVGDKATIVPIIGELQDRDYIRFILGRLKADVIFHCAAYKHVPMVEANPIEAIKNNVFGTKTLAEASIEMEISKLVFISTDKSVSPVSIYGASKYIAEQIVLGHRDESPRTSCMVVRFGNVLGSRGSIVPLLRKQIEKGGPVTITDPKAKRFFMTIPEAASLVLKTGGMGKNGGLYVLDMGEPILIEDLARQMISFYGYTPEKDIKIQYIGLRPGEKLEEQLWNGGENPVSTEHVRVLTIPSMQIETDKLKSLLTRLEPVCFFRSDRPEEYRNKIRLKKIIGDFIPSIKIDQNETPY